MSLRRSTTFATAALLMLASAALPLVLRSQATAASLEAAAKEAEQAGRLKEAFDGYVRAVQALPDPPPIEVDARLRDKLATLVDRIQPRPPQPEDAERYAVRGQVLFKEAKDIAAFKEAAAEMRKSVRAAPWEGALAYNLALVEEKLEYYKSATANLKVYLRSNPKDATEARAKVYELELRLEKNAPAGIKEDCDFDVARACVALGKSQAQPGGYKYLILGCTLGDAEGCVSAALSDLSTARSLKKLKGDPTNASTRALDWFGKGCDLGRGDACVQLGDMYAFELGALGFKTDKAKAAEMHTKGMTALMKGCDAQSGGDCAALGAMYEDGHGVKKDRATAASFYARACAMDRAKFVTACTSATRLKK